MAENFVVSLNAVLPLVLSMALGFFLQRSGLLAEATRLNINNLIFKVFLPALLFCNIYTADLSSAVDSGAVLLAVGCTAITFFALFFAIGRTRLPNPKKGVVLQGATRANVALYGLPIAMNYYSAEQSAPVALVIAAVIPVFNILAVLSLELFRRDKVNWKAIAKGIVTNPPILGIVLALALNLLQITLPQAIYSTVNGLANVTTPLSFIVMGASFQFASAVENRKLIAGVSLFKLVLYPLLWVSLAIFLGFRGPVLLAITVVFAAPVATSIFPMSASMGGDSQLACELVVFTSIFSLITVFLWIFCLKSLAFI